MQTSTHSGVTLRVLTELSRAKRGFGAWGEDWPMLKLIGWAATISLIAGLIWYVSNDISVLARSVAGIALVTVGLLGGLHISSHSAAAYIRDVQRLNKV